ncbi:hypothetical protein MKW92_029615 [Papaver armeniacum]|nr:hypothetical protein MKW92_029615 [Papaver armeniacum]
MSSWYENPQLFICNASHEASDGFNVYKCCKEPSGPIHVSDLKRISSGVKKESVFDALLAYLIDFYVRSGSKIWRIVNCQGLAILWDQSSGREIMCSWSREPLDSPYYNLPGITPPIDAEKEALKKRVSDLESRNAALETEVQMLNEENNNEIRELEKEVSELTRKLKECCGSADEESWKIGNSTVPSNWVPFEDLDALNIPKKTFLKIIKAPGALKFVEDNTTNVRGSRFYGGIYLAAVNIEELIPDKDEARFDPAIWGVYEDDAGTSYAARKMVKPEM